MKEITPEALNELCRNTMVSHLGIKILTYKEGLLTASMPVDERNIQPMGFLHGGASLALAETVASIGSAAMTNTDEYHVFGVQVSGNHLNTARSGSVFAEAVLIHHGKSSHVWNIDITSENGKLISTARVSIAIVKKK